MSWFSSLIVFFLFIRATGSSEASERIPPGTPEVVIVTLLDDSLSKSYIEKIKENRDDYAARHGKPRIGLSAIDSLLNTVQVTKRGIRASKTTTLARRQSHGLWFLPCDMRRSYTHTPLTTSPFLRMLLSWIRLFRLQNMSWSQSAWNR